MRKLLIVAALATVLAGCGSKKPLTRVAGDEVPPAPALARTAPTSEELITPDDQARPERQDEILKQSEEREDDKFDLPPTT
ncbi:lipoprotein [Sphingomonas cavernae]|uniref:Uncharacterized protein n=1 Tax=Sphingomonas cavernae TaxID=2320861 RepID=A0A418WRX5_9SPHN|nr:lipoprotein [Sphingomonas cavernae]RJF93981.1 hypothetical protein D3876_06850 [Sphingomonas cavernae]